MREYENKYINSEKTAWDLRSILWDIGRSWWMILLVALSVSLLTYSAISFTHEDRYTVSTTFTVSQSGGDSNAVSNLSAAYEMAQKFSVILENNILKKTVMEELGLDSFPATMNASVVEESNLMQLSVTADSPQNAYLILESVLRNYPTLSDYIIPNVVLQTLEQPQISGSPSNQLPVRKYMLYAFLTAAAAVAAVIGVTSYLRDTVKNEQEFSQKVDAYLLGTIYHEKKKKKSSMLITNPVRSFRYVEAYRMAASRVRGRMDRKHAKILLVTSVAENEGKSTTASNLALALAQEQKKVLLVDCDFRRPALHKIFDVGNREIKDFSLVLQGKEKVGGIFEKVQNLPLYTAFSRHSIENPSELISDGRLERLLRSCCKKMDYVILDSPPMGLAVDAEELIQIADAAVLSVRQDAVLTQDINDAIDVLNQKDEKVIGCVYSNVYPPIGERFRQGAYGYEGYGKYSKADR